MFNPRKMSNNFQAEEGKSDNLQAVVDQLISQKKSSAPEVKDERIKETRKQRIARRKIEKMLRKKAQPLKIPKTVQESIPYLRVYPESGIIETQNGDFCKSYLLNDINYYAAKDEDQAGMFLKYADLLNFFDPSMRFQISVHQQQINIAEFESECMLPITGSELDDLRQDLNTLLRHKIRAGKNELVQYKYLTVSTHAPSYEAAESAFLRLDTEIVSNVKAIGGAIAEPLNTARRLEVLHDIYNPNHVGLFGNVMDTDDEGNLVFRGDDKFSFDVMRKMGLHTKDMIGPDSMKFRSDYGMTGSCYFRALCMRTYPQTIKDRMLKELTDADCKMVISMQYQPIDPVSASRMINRERVNVNANIADRQKKASKAGYSLDLVSPELNEHKRDNEILRDDVTNKNQKLFYQTFVLVHFADSLEQLNADTQTIQGIARGKFVTNLMPLSWQQENGLNTCLPLCYTKLEIKRTMITENAAAFMPFVNQELNDRRGGIFYGINAVSKNMIVLDRRLSKNGNGIILGQPGSGKSFIAKLEMISVALRNDDDLVVVIDPEGEYKRLASMHNGEVVRIAPGSDVHINLFDINMNTDTIHDDPISFKADYLCSVCETIIDDRHKNGLTAGQKSIIDRCVRSVYKPFLASQDPTTGEYNNDLVPTLRDFYHEVRKQDGYEAMQLADALELYATGTQNIFAHKTNVQYNSKFVVYDISDIGSSMKALGELVVLSTVWNQIVAGRKKGHHVWFYIDEIWLLFQNRLSAEFIRDLYKRARKYGGLPTGITQNVSDMLENDVARTMISNCEFVQMLSQGATERAQLGALLNISPTQMEAITNAPSGHGLLYNGTSIVPFVSEIPKESVLYKAMTTTLSEVKEIERQEQHTET